MHLLAPQKSLVTLLARVAPFAPPKSPMPVLPHVQLRAVLGEALGKGKIVAATTDMDVGCVAEMEADVAASGSVTVPVRDILARMKSMPVGDVDINVTETSVQMRAIGSARRFSLTAGVSGEFPKIPEPAQDASKIVVPTKLLVDRLSKAMPSSALDEARPHVNGVLLDWGHGKFRAVATDGHRLALSEASLGDGDQANRTVLIPREAIARVLGLLDPLLSAETSITVDGYTVFFDIAGVGRVFVKTTDAVFPPYANIIPDDLSRPVRANRTKLAEAVRCVALATKGGSNEMVRFAFLPGSIQFSAESPEHGSAYDEIVLWLAGAPSWSRMRAIAVRRSAPTSHGPGRTSTTSRRTTAGTFAGRSATATRRPSSATS